MPRPGYGDGEYNQRLLASKRASRRVCIIRTSSPFIRYQRTRRRRSTFFAMDYDRRLGFGRICSNGAACCCRPKKRWAFWGKSPRRSGLRARAQRHSPRHQAGQHSCCSEHARHVRLGERWAVKVADFGISRAAEDTEGTRLHQKRNVGRHTRIYVVPNKRAAAKLSIIAPICIRWRSWATKC